MSQGLHDVNTQIYEEAGEWVVRHRDGNLDARSRRRFDAWLRESPHHVRAYLEMSSVWENLAALDPTWNADADELIVRAREDHVVHPLLKARSGTNRVPAAIASPTRARYFFALAATLFVAVGIAGWLYLQRNVYSTGIGEQRTIALTDGSTIELNALSKIDVRFSERERTIDLLAGQALFRVAKDPVRPFIVASNEAQVRAVGTQFDVYQKRAGTLVTVVEGRVAVIDDARHAAQRPVDASRATGPSAAPDERTGSLDGVLVSAGEQMLIAQGSSTPPRFANVEAATAWTQQRLVFDFTSLTDVAEEFNRYNYRPLVIDDVSLGDFHVSGSFSSTDPTLLLRFLRDQPGMHVNEMASEIRISRQSN
jgi:transmembrane sensor